MTNKGIPEKDIKQLQQWQTVVNNLRKIYSDILFTHRTARHLQEALVLIYFAVNTQAQQCCLYKGDWPDGKIQTDKGKIHNIEITEVMEDGRKRDKEYKERVASDDKLRVTLVDPADIEKNWLKSVRNAIEKKLSKNYNSTCHLDILVYDNTFIFRRKELPNLISEVEELFLKNSFGDVTIWLSNLSFLYRIWPNPSLIVGKVNTT